LGKRCKQAAQAAGTKLAAAKPGSDEARYLTDLKAALEQGGKNPAEPCARCATCPARSFPSSWRSSARRRSKGADEVDEQTSVSVFESQVRVQTLLKEGRRRPEVLCSRNV